MKKNWFSIPLAAAAALLVTVPCFAASWHYETDGSGGRYWYGDASNYYRSGWYWVDGNADGIAERYYFDSEGWLLVNGTAPDGSYANSQGAWTVDGIVQTRWEKAGPSGDITTGSGGGPAGKISRGQNTEPNADGREDLSGYRRAEYTGGSWRSSQYAGKYYVNPDGVREKFSIAVIDGETYAFGDGGYPLTGWRKIDGKWMYFFKKRDPLGGIEGAAAKSMYVGSYRLDEQGFWDGR